jgi:hypothetical protein
MYVNIAVLKDPHLMNGGLPWCPAGLEASL